MYQSWKRRSDLGEWGRGLYSSGLPLTQSWGGHGPSLSVRVPPLTNEWFAVHFMWRRGSIGRGSLRRCVLRRILKLYLDGVEKSPRLCGSICQGCGWGRECGGVQRGLLAIFGLDDLEVSFSFTFWDALIC